MPAEIGGDPLDRHTLIAVAGDPDNIITKPFRVQQVHSQTTPLGEPTTYMLSSDFTVSSKRGKRPPDAVEQSRPAIRRMFDDVATLP
jgi:hypothetical protein